MPRNHWQVPGTEWVQILRLPRPPSVKWPNAGQQQQRQPGKPQSHRSFIPRKGVHCRSPLSVPPQQMRASATATILSVDGIGAYDHVLRAAIMERLEKMPGAGSILPFVRLSYAPPSKYSWWDDDGQKRTVTQAEGGEQGDPLMPLLFSIGIQGALEEVSAVLQLGEQLCAFFDDVYALCQPARVKVIHDALVRALHRVAGIRLHQGNTRVWNKGGVQPDHVDTLGGDAWQPHGIVVLAPHLAVHQSLVAEPHRRGARTLGDNSQCARFAVWLSNLSANRRANHTLRTLSHPSRLSTAANMTRAFGTQPGHCWARFRARWMLSKMRGHYRRCP